ncbi:MAG: hypothetical protein HFG81_05870 [Dorea sp.]|nr:hypothetical protein [uncultured Acetatifactor sp.]MCI9422227.1 hypothetical protein [Dorea sp.]
MGRYEKMLLLSKIIGKRNLCRLQSALKYALSFRGSYNNQKNTTKRNWGGKTYVFIVDGKTPHGGLSDRLRGLFSVYDYCKERGYIFKILWIYPENIQNYFVPASVDWRIEPEEMVYDRKIVDFRFFNSYSFMNNDEKSYAKLLDSKKPIIHVYSNVTIHEEKFDMYFRELFVLSAELDTAVRKQLSAIGSEYISISFRLADLLGDFVDCPDIFPELENEKVKEEYIGACINAIKTLKEKNPEISKILVTADSAKFLQEAEKLSYVYIVSGTIVHMDQANKNDEMSQIKNYLDFLLIAKAIKCYYFVHGRMYASTRFASTAALIGGKKIEQLKI